MKTARTILSIVTATALLAATTGLVACGPKEPETIKIGAILPLTGDAALYGKEEKNGIEMALNFVKEEGIYNGEIEVVYEDSVSDPKHAMSAFEKLMLENPDVIVTVLSSVSMALAPRTEEYGVPLFCVAAHPGITDYKDVYRMYPSARYQGKMIADLTFNELGLKKVSAFYINDDLGNSITESFKTEYTSLGGEVLIAESYEDTATDFRSIITKIINSEPEGIFLIGFGSRFGLAIKQIRELGYKGQLIGTPELPYPDVLDTAGEAAEGAVFLDINIDKSDERVRDFIADYMEKYGSEPDLDAFLGYDELLIIAYAAERARLNGSTLNEELTAIDNVEGLTGMLSVDTEGNVLFPLIIKTIKEGEAVEYETGV